MKKWLMYFTDGTTLFGEVQEYFETQEEAEKALLKEHKEYGKLSGRVGLQGWVCKVETKSRLDISPSGDPSIERL